MIVTITSLVPRKARRIPGIAPAIPPAIRPTKTVQITEIGFGRPGNERANQTDITQPINA